MNIVSNTLDYLFFSERHMTFTLRKLPEVLRGEASTE